MSDREEFFRLFFAARVKQMCASGQPLGDESVASAVAESVRLSGVADEAMEREMAPPPQLKKKKGDGEKT